MIPVAVYVVIGYGAVFVMSIVLHEVAHGFVAYRCGDPTAKLAGRLTLNPVRHVDLFYSLLMPVLCVLAGLPMFGGAKPVPVSPFYFRHFVRDERLVSAAGVVTNLVIAWALGMLLHLLFWLKVITPDSPHTIILGMGVISNLVLFVFNLTPIPPLDGSRILRSFLPGTVRAAFDRMDRFGLFLVLFVVMFVPGFDRLLFSAIQFLWEVLLRQKEDLFWQVLDGFRHALK